MASENTVEIGFTGDTSSLSESLETMNAQITATSQQLQQLFSSMNEQSAAEAKYYTSQMQFAAQQSSADWQAAFAPISRAFDSSIDGMVRGTQTLDQTVRRLAQNIIAEYADMAAESTVHWVASEAQKTYATLAGNNARTASTTGAASEGMAIEAGSNEQSVVGNAWSAAAAVYNNVAQIPYVGWVLAPAAAATAAAAVLAFGSSIPSAAGGWVVPSDTMAMVHENEMILPAHLSQGIAGMIAGGQGGGGHTFNNTFHVQAGNGVTAQQLPDMIVKTMGKALRNGQFGAMRSA